MGLRLSGLSTESLTALLLQIDFLILEHLEVCWGQFRDYTLILHTTSSSWSVVKVLNSPNGADLEVHSVDVQDFDFLMERFWQDTQKKKKEIQTHVMMSNSIYGYSDQRESQLLNYCLFKLNIKKNNSSLMDRRTRGTKKGWTLNLYNQSSRKWKRRDSISSPLEKIGTHA